ncbi:MAG: FAD-dependent oxidoreductase, partial [Planctomycetaceae bacterium]|nr:FAD-dependent oxidoreductase [Planctomycetaceae bacterium]
APQLFGGTKGSHFLTHQPALCDAVAGQGIYAEAEDGRLVFVLPLAGGVMVGTTDERFEGDPDQAIASEPELDYLLEMTNDLFPQVNLTRDDIEMHCAGVRPLPKADESKTSTISRDHSIHVSEQAGTPILTLVGGKLTTARAFGETVADEVLSRLQISRTRDSRDRVFPGGENYPSPGELPKVWYELAKQHNRTQTQVQAMWALCGTRVREFLSSSDGGVPTPLLGTELPRDFVKWIIETEWVQTLDDLIERRLMLVYHPRLSVECVRQLTELLVEAGRMSSEEIDNKIAGTVSRLHSIYGKTVHLESATDHFANSPSQ